MTVGVDFDNTIVCYDAIFHRIAIEKNLVPPSLAPSKTAVRDWLRQQAREDEWTRLQGEVYGSRMADADIFPGVREFFRKCRSSGVAIRIISHKTRHPFLGKQYDLHAAAYQWLDAQGFFDPAGCALARENIFFELTKPEKIARVAACGCEAFIDDLPEILSDPALPPSLCGILFDPAGILPGWSASPRATSWAEISRLLLPGADAPI